MVEPEPLDGEALDLASIVREAIDEIYVIDARTGRFLYANDLALEDTGYSLDELRLMTPLDLQKGTGVEELTKRIEALRRGEQHVVIFETDYYRKDGSSYLVEHRLQLLRSQEPPVFVARARGIAERRLPIASLVQDEAFYRQMVEGTVEGVWAIDANGTTTFVNDTMASMIGYTRDEIVGVPLFDFMDDEGKAITMANLERRRSGIAERLDFRMHKKDGTVLWILVAAHPLFDGDGQYAGSVAIIADITDRKLRERALLDMLHVETPEELWGASLPSLTKPVVRMPEAMGVRAERVAKRFSILADPKRLHLIELLASGEERSVTVLAESIGMTQSNVSKHLKILAEAALVNRRREGTTTFYSLADPTVAILCRIVCQWLGSQAQAEYQALAS